ncbi:MAG TPA: caspase family protein [Candidatus Sulfopaludibacter sp.]|jgi:uncharacterized caspase-like protein|nr:caspase family protein [Candidatus Sulfopaludibacter sp.]
MRRFLVAILLAPVVYGQVADRCSPGWSMLNLLREQLTPDTPQETLELMQARIGRRLAACREIPDLWYYRSVVAERLHDAKDAAYARKEAASLNSEALRGKLNPFDAAPVAAPVLPAAMGQKYAVVVGINKFVSAPELHFAVNDARGFAGVLEDPQVGRFRKENVTTLVDDDATLSGIRTAIGTVRERVKPEDLVVIYIASHGSPRASDPNGVSYVITHDTKLDTAANLYATSLQMIDLVEILRRDVKARRVVLILDTCFSGDATGERGVAIHTSDAAAGPATEFSVATDRFEDKSTGSARVVISASRANEQSREDPALQHGYFTYYLLEALRNHDGKTPLSDVFQFVHDHTLKAVQDKFGVSQTPTMRNTPEGLSLVLGAVPGGD